jgi:type II secretory pathway component PulM
VKASRRELHSLGVVSAVFWKGVQERRDLFVILKGTGLAELRLYYLLRIVNPRTYRSRL